MFFSHIEPAPPDPILGLQQAFHADPRPHKVDLGVGIFKTADLKMPVMECVKEAEKLLFPKETVGNYLPIDGDPQFLEEAAKLALGEIYPSHKGRIYAAQSVGGTGALRVMAEFLFSLGMRKVFLPDPTWPNHLFIFQRAGFTVERYPYYAKEKKGVDMAAFKKFLSSVEEKSPVILHASCHNPTGCDPTPEEWEELAAIFHKRKLLAVFDMAYQGFGEGLDEDAASVRIFAKTNREMAFITTCAKNFSLYSQRVGALFLLLDDEKKRAAVASQVKKIIRPIYSNPPAHGALIVKEILTHPALREKWKKELAGMRARLNGMRAKLVELLPDGFDFLRKHKGMFSFCHLSKEEVHLMKEKYGIYLTDDGRISLAGLNDENIGYVAKAIKDITQ